MHSSMIARHFLVHCSAALSISQPKKCSSPIELLVEMPLCSFTFFIQPHLSRFAMINYFAALNIKVNTNEMPRWSDVNKGGIAVQFCTGSVFNNRAKSISD